MWDDSCLHISVKLYRASRVNLYRASREFLREATHHFTENFSWSHSSLHILVKAWVTSHCEATHVFTIVKPLMRSHFWKYDIDKNNTKSLGWYIKSMILPPCFNDSILDIIPPYFHSFCLTHGFTTLFVLLCCQITNQERYIEVTELSTINI